MAFCFLKYQHPCKSKEKKHPKTEIVPVSRIVNCDEKEIKHKCFKVNCGGMFCEASIAFVADSKEKVKKNLEESRAKFPPNHLLRHPTSDLYKFAEEALSEIWMRTKLKLPEDEIAAHLKNGTDYIGKKISELNRGPRNKRKKVQPKKSQKKNQIQRKSERR